MNAQVPGPPGPPTHTHLDGTTCMWVKSRYGRLCWRSVDESGHDLGPCPAGSWMRKP